MNAGYPSRGVRRAVTAAVMAATLMNALDTTIANVALPHIQGSVSASAEEINWVLTSYIVAAAIATPMTGWLADRFGRKPLMLWSIIGFTAVSALCGLATNLPELVLFRLLQGAFGAALQPMSQATMLDMSPPDEQAKAMGIWSMGALIGPILGPTVGGWLTESLSWRWVFYINLPIGILAAIGVQTFMRASKSPTAKRFDLFGFSMLGLAIASLQLMLDRGQTQDWFDSSEICLEAAAAIVFGYLFVAHVMTAEHPFLDLRLFGNRNFVIATLLLCLLMVLMFGVLTLMPAMLQRLMGYPVVLTGMVTAPRGLGSMVTMGFAGLIMKRLGARPTMTIGFLLTALSVYIMSQFSLGMDARPVMLSGFIQGMGSGMIFVSLSLLAFGTLSPELRNQGTAMLTLMRNIGAAAGISLLQAMTIRASAAVHSRLIEGIRPDNPTLMRALPNLDFTNTRAMAALEAQISRQSAMVSYVDIFWLLFVCTLAAIPFVFLLQPLRPTAAGPEPHVHMD